MDKKVVNKSLCIPTHSSQTIIETELHHGEYVIEIEPYASLTYIIAPRTSSGETVYRIRVDKHATCKIIMLAHDISHIIKCDFQLYEHARLDLKGALLLTGKNNVECVTTQRHKEPNAQSSVLIKTMLYDVSSFDYRGTIAVAQEAQHTAALQYNKNLMLSSQARATSVPSLEVIADSVSCKHGTATASLNDEHLQYLQSRGIRKEDARRLLIEAFFAEINNDIPDIVRDSSILQKFSIFGTNGLFGNINKIRSS